MSRVDADHFESATGHQRPGPEEPASTEMVSEKEDPSLSVVIPVFNEEENLPDLIARSLETFAEGGLRSCGERVFRTFSVFAL